MQPSDVSEFCAHQPPLTTIYKIPQLTEYIELLLLYGNPPNGVYWIVNIYETPPNGIYWIVDIICIPI